MREEYVLPIPLRDYIRPEFDTLGILPLRESPGLRIILADEIVGEDTGAEGSLELGLARQDIGGSTLFEGVERLIRGTVFMRRV